MDFERIHGQIKKIRNTAELIYRRDKIVQENGSPDFQWKIYIVVSIYNYILANVHSSSCFKKYGILHSEACNIPGK